MSDSPWIHSICDQCWAETEPDRIPIRLILPDADAEKCCRCGQLHASGINVKARPDSYACGGNHAVK